MRSISVRLGDATEIALIKLQNQHPNASISDLINIAIMVLSEDTSNFDIIPQDGLWRSVKKAAREHQTTIEMFCESNGINKEVLRVLCYRIQNGSRVKGFGDSNKNRDKKDERIYRTNSAYMVDCIKNKLGVDMEAYNGN